MNKKFKPTHVPFWEQGSPQRKTKYAKIDLFLVICVLAFSYWIFS